jgi:hypothetical protein
MIAAAATIDGSSTNPVTPELEKSEKLRKFKNLEI